MRFPISNQYHLGPILHRIATIHS